MFTTGVCSAKFEIAKNGLASANAFGLGNCFKCSDTIHGACGGCDEAEEHKIGYCNDVHREFPFGTLAETFQEVRERRSLCDSTFLYSDAEASAHMRSRRQIPYKPTR
jgi:hypothetical protein